MNIRLHKHSVPNQRYVIPNDNVWKLYQVSHSPETGTLIIDSNPVLRDCEQIQDAANHLTSALDILSAPPLRFKYSEGKYDFHSADEVIQVWDAPVHRQDRLTSYES